MGLSLMPTSVVAVRHKALWMLIRPVLTSLKITLNERQQPGKCAHVPRHCVSQLYTQAPSKNGQVVAPFLGFHARRNPFVWTIPSHRLSHTCSYLPAAGERLGRSLAGFTSDTSTANCQTGFLEVDADKQLSLPRQPRPDSVSMVSESGCHALILFCCSTY